MHVSNLTKHRKVILSSQTLTALLFLAWGDLNQQRFVHASFLCIHHSAKFEFFNQMRFLAQGHRLRHLRFDKLCVHDCILLQLQESVSLPLVQCLFLLANLYDVLAISIWLLDFTLLFLGDLRFQIVQHLYVLPASLQLSFQILLPRLLIF